MQKEAHNKSIRNKIFSVIFLFVSPAVSIPQVIGFFPPADSISVIGSCVPPALFCQLINVQGGVDTIEIRSAWNDPMFAGSPLGERIERCFFAVRDSLNLNQYQLWMKSLRPYVGDPQIINFDSSFYVWGILILRLCVNGGMVDSAQARFFADATGDVGPEGSGKPGEARILHNYPNPFNSLTVVNYSVPPMFVSNGNGIMG